MAFHTISSNVPIDFHEPLISFKVRGEQVAALYPDGTVIAQGDSIVDRSVATGYFTQSYVPTSPGGSPTTPASGMGGNVDGGNF
jgi:hypothetical protein